MALSSSSSPSFSQHPSKDKEASNVAGNCHQRRHGRLALLDRDGVINEDVGSPGVLDPSTLQLTPCAAQAIGNLCRHGYRVVMITNQSCVGKGLISSQKLSAIQTHLQQMLLEEDPEACIHQIYQCTSTKEDNDPRLKPSPGMILEALQDYYGDKEGDFTNEANDDSDDDDDDDKSLCFFVGDKLSDMEAATYGGIPLRFLVSTGYGSSIMKDHIASQPKTNEALLIDSRAIEPKREEHANLLSVLPFYYVRNLASAVEHVLSMTKS